MGGRGTFAAGNNVPYTFKTVGFINDVKVLEGIGGKHGLPEESHSSDAYIQLNPNDTFRELRLYDKEHYLYFELAYHREASIGPKGMKVLHYHLYDRNFNRSTFKASKAMRKHFSKYLKGVKL